jgi:oligopeptide transport system ATP-binding protein
VSEPQPLLDIENVSKTYAVRGQAARLLRGEPAESLTAVSDVSLTVYRGEVVGLVGESGCGKSTLARLIVNLEPPTTGRIVYDGAELGAQDRRALRRLRRRIQMVFQDPYSSLNPRKAVGKAIEEVLSVHQICPKQERRNRVAELLERVGLSADMMDRRPREFSGGQRQRIGIARALAVSPEFVVADEPVSALDVSVQAQVLNLLMRLRQELNLTYLFISHNLGVIEHISDRVAIMYLGKLVEIAPAQSVFESPRHPYTQALLAAVPSLDPDESIEAAAVEGDIPNPINPPAGCYFHPRCPFAMEICSREYPRMRLADEDSLVACHLYPESLGKG